MKKLFVILSLTFLLAGELEVDGDLTVSGTIQNDSLQQVIAAQQQQIEALQSLVLQLQNQVNYIGYQLQYTDCAGVVGGSSFVNLCGDCVIENNEEECPSAADADGNIYTHVTIGEQVWLRENLKTTRYNDGTDIEDGSIDWPGGESGLYIEEEGQFYYNWFSVNDDRGICPENFHIPSDDEWKELELFLGMCPGGNDEDYFNNPNGVGCVDNQGFRGDDEGNQLINSIDFNILFVGYIEDHSDATVGSTQARYWTSTEAPEHQGQTLWSYHRGLSPEWEGIYRNDWDKNKGLSVRCIQD